MVGYTDAQFPTIQRLKPTSPHPCLLYIALYSLPSRFHIFHRPFKIIGSHCSRNVMIKLTSVGRPFGWLPVVYLNPFITLILAIFLVLVLSYVTTRLLPQEGNKNVIAPIIGPRGTIRGRWMFFRNAADLLNRGYEMVST